MSEILFDIAEVLEYDDTYRYIDPSGSNTNVSNLFSIKVRSCASYFNDKPFIVQPASANIKQIPLVGEIVLIYKTFNQASTPTKRRDAWYYLTTLNIQSSIHANSLPGLSNSLITQEEIDAAKPGKTFQYKTVSPLQPYEGDLLLEGRFGNSIRFGNTVKTGGIYSVNAPWAGILHPKQPDPIIILSNGRKNLLGKQFVAENIQTDDSSIYLTSTQKLSAFKLNNRIRQSTSQSAFAKSQFIGTADRIVLKSKSDIIILDSKLAVELNSPIISMGVKRSKEPVLHSTAVETIINIIMQILNGGLTDSNGAPVVADPSLIANISKQLTQLKNKSILQDTYKG
jgi:hypothetical protein